MFKKKIIDSSEGQLPIVLEKTKSNENHENQNESSFQKLSKTLKEIEELINLIPSNKENDPVIESLKQKIKLGQTQLLELQKTSKEEIVQNNNPQNIDNKMNLMLNKIDILIDMMNSNHAKNENTEEVIEKIYDNGDKYIGQFKYGKKNGKGKMFYADKSYYEGEWYNDLKNGQGHQTMNNGDIYDGTFKNNLMEGYGNYLLQEMNILEISKKDYLMGKELSYIQMEIDMKDYIKMERKMVLEFIILSLEKFIKENGSKMKGMEKVY